MFNPNIVIGKKVLSARLKKKVKTDESSMLLHILTFDPPDEKMSVLNLPNQVIIFDVKNMSRVFDVPVCYLTEMVNCFYLIEVGDSYSNIAIFPP